MDMKRYAIYYAPEAGAFADAAAFWLGWDPVAGRAVPQPDLPGIYEQTADPRKYGFHGTIKPPFRLAEGVDFAQLCDEAERLAHGLAPVVMDGLQLIVLEGFAALVPRGNVTALTALAADVVARLDHLRAPLTEAEITRRRPERLTARQRALLDEYGYPYVMEEFRFHLTLTGRDPGPGLITAAQARFAPHLPQPFVLQELCLFGEALDGSFHLLHRYPLAA